VVVKAGKEVVDIIKRRLGEEAWDVVEAWLDDPWSFVARVRRKRDGKVFLARLSVIGGELELVPEGWVS